MSPVKNAVIAAAGLGSRLGLGMPKCMISVNKTPILARVLKTLSKHVESIVIVTGYREELIFEYCQNHFRDVIIARNPAYATTNTAQSFSIGARFVSGKTIFLDGDLLFEEVSLARFFKLAERAELLVGVAEARTEQPVFAHCSAQSDGYLAINGFSREERSTHEWANVFVGPHNIMDGAQRYVFERLSEALPVSAALIEVEEVDTPQDLARAEAAVQAWDGS